jgi:hypothetical protein
VLRFRLLFPFSLFLFAFCYSYAQFIPFSLWQKRSPAILTYTGAYAGSSTFLDPNQSQTFTNQSIGEPNAKRYIVAVIYYRNQEPANDFPEVTIGGIATYRIAQPPSITTNQFGFIVVTTNPLPSGTTADVVITNSDITSTRRQVFLYHFIPSSTSPNVLASEWQTEPANETLFWNFSAYMTSRSSGVHLTYVPNTSTINNPTGSLTYDRATEIVTTGRARIGTIQINGIYSTPISGSASSGYGVAAILE